MDVSDYALGSETEGEKSDRVVTVVAGFVPTGDDSAPCFYADKAQAQEARSLEIMLCPPEARDAILARELTELTLGTAGADPIIFSAEDIRGKWQSYNSPGLDEPKSTERSSRVAPHGWLFQTRPDLFTGRLAICLKLKIGGKTKVCCLPVGVPLPPSQDGGDGPKLRKEYDEARALILQFCINPENYTVSKLVLTLDPKGVVALTMKDLRRLFRGAQL